MPDLIPYTDAPLSTRQSRQTSRALARLEHQTRIRLAAVQAEGMVQAEKLREVDHLVREAMTGQALLAAGPTAWPPATRSCRTS